MKALLQLFRDNKAKKGFVLPLTLIVCVIILTIATSISIILAKELYFSKLSRLSQVAYYAADNGLMCATMIDDQYIDPDTGGGIFQYNTLVTSQDVLNKINSARTTQGLSAIALNDIKCATSDIFDATKTNFAVTSFSRTDSAGNPESGQTSTFNMRMDLGGGEYRCATVSVNKTSTYRQIISRGFASCDSVFSYPIERAIVSTSESVGIATSTGIGGGGGGSPSSGTVVLTSGNSWTVPAGVTSIKVWAIGAGGGGAGSIALDQTSGGGGGAGGTAYKVFSVAPNDSVSYAVGAAGLGGSGGTSGGTGGATSVTVNSVTITGAGGSGGSYNTGSSGQGGGISGPYDSSSWGGYGSGASGDTGGGGGGGIGGTNGLGNGNAGGNGGQAADVAGLFAALSQVGYPVVSPGTGGGPSSSNINNMNGTNATGFGNGGGGAGWYGGNGGNGLYGGGGGGAAGYTAGQVGGNGGTGVVVISY